MSAKTKRDSLWQKIEASAAGPGIYPDMAKMKAFGEKMDYSSLLNYEEDTQPPGREKVLCSAGGACAKVRFEWKEQARQFFTGMFSDAEHGIARCSSINEPTPASSWSPAPTMIPMFALKFFRDDDGSSANLVLAHRKSGQKETNFFAHALSNHFTENVKWPFKAALKIFQKYSDFPTFSGLSEFASKGQDGHAVQQPKAPYVLVLRPLEEHRKRQVPASKLLVDQLTHFAAGDTLYEVYAVPEPLSTNRSGAPTQNVCKLSEVSECPAAPAIWHVGKLKLDSPFIASQFADEKLFFRHHLFEGDLKLRPDWKVKVDTMLGAPFYDEVIDTGSVWDPESTNAEYKDPDADCLSNCADKVLLQESEQEVLLADSAIPQVVTEFEKENAPESEEPQFDKSMEEGRNTRQPAISDEASKSDQRQDTVITSSEQPQSGCPFLLGLCIGSAGACPFFSALGSPTSVQEVTIESTGRQKDEVHAAQPIASDDQPAPSRAEPKAASPRQAVEPLVTGQDGQGVVTVFTIDACPHCRRVSTVMDDLSWEYTVISLSAFPEKRKDLLSLCNRLTCPQVFFNSKHIGGAAEFTQLIASLADPAALYAEIVKEPAPRDPRLLKPDYQPMTAELSADATTTEKTPLVIAGQEYDVRDFVSNLIAGVRVQDHKKRMGLRSYPQSFKAFQVIDYLVSTYKLTSRQDAVQLCNQLQKSGVFNPVDYDDRESFEDGNHLYRFQYHEAGLWKALNVERLCDVSNPSPAILKKLSDMLTQIIMSHTNKEGRIDYVKANTDPCMRDFLHGVCELQALKLSAMDTQTRKAFVINVYNMMVVHATIVLGIPSSNGQRMAFFNGVRYKFGENVYSLFDLENGILRGNRHPPYHLRAPFAAGDTRLADVLTLDYRIHFAVNCGARSCPAVRWYTAESLDEELSHASIGWVNNEENVKIDAPRHTLYLSKICNWFSSDFGKSKMEIGKTIAQHAQGTKKEQMHALLADKFKIKHLPYDWSSQASANRAFNDQCYTCIVK